MKIIYIYKENDPLNPFIERHIRLANLNETDVTCMTLSKNEELKQPYLVFNHHTIIFEDECGCEINRINGPFDNGVLLKKIGAVKKYLRGDYV